MTGRFRDAELCSSTFVGVEGAGDWEREPSRWLERRYRLGEGLDGLAVEDVVITGGGRLAVERGRRG